MSSIAGKIINYFGAKSIEDGWEEPSITATFLVGKGWVPLPTPAPATIEAIRLYGTIRGVTAVAVSSGQRTADFQIQEILDYAERPLFGGKII